MQSLPSTYAVLPNACRLPTARRRSDLAERERPPPRGGRLPRNEGSKAVPTVVRSSLTP